MGIAFMGRHMRGWRGEQCRPLRRPAPIASQLGRDYLLFHLIARELWIRTRGPGDNGPRKYKCCLVTTADRLLAGLAEPTTAHSFLPVP